MRSSEAIRISILATLLVACGLTTTFDDFDTSSALPRYAVKGRVEGLEGARIRLLVNGESPGIVTGDGEFTMPAAAIDGRSFEISATDVPIDHPCVLEGARGTIQGADATGVVVRCWSTVSALAALELSGTSLTPAFEPKVRSYSARVRTSFFAASQPATTMITATATSPSARIALGNVTLVSGQPSAPIVLAPGRNGVELTVSPAAPDAPTTTYAIAIEGREHDYLKAPSVRAGASFGATIAVSGDTLVVGARQFGFGDPTVTAPGAAFVFRRTPAGWLQEAQLLGPAGSVSSLFGFSVAISGVTIVVGAPSDSSGSAVDPNDKSKANAGAAWVFVRSGSTWSQQAYLKAPNIRAGSRFGSSVAIDGESLVVGATDESSSATGVGGDELDESAPYRGAAFVFERSGVLWTKTAYLKRADPGNGMFGLSAAIAGNVIAIGAYGGKPVTVFSRPAVGAPWVLEASLMKTEPSDDRFGNALALSGETLVVGDVGESTATLPDTGAAYVFRRSAGTTNWSQEAHLVAQTRKEEIGFGGSVAIVGQTIVVGAASDSSASTFFDGDSTDESSPSSGAIQIFRRNATTWEPSTYVKAPRNLPGIGLGASVALAADGTLFGGAPSESSGAIGVDGDETDRSAPYSGAVYVFH